MTERKYQQIQTVYSFIKNYEEEHKYAPSYAEIGDCIHLSSTSSIHRLIQEMLSLQILETDINREILSPRAIRIGVLGPKEIY